MSPELRPVALEAAPITWPTVDEMVGLARAPEPESEPLTWLLAADEGALPTTVAQRLEIAERDAYQRGLADGQAMVTAEADARCRASEVRVQETLVDLADLRIRTLRHAERDLVRLALALAARVVHRDVSADPALLLTVAREAATRLGDQANAVVRVHPDALAAVERALSADESGRSFQLVADPALPPGGCVVESPAGTVDASVDAQFAALADELLGANSPDASRE